MKTKLLVIVGPTASGKSALAVKMAKKLNGEVISADSRQVYTGFDIGTGKITKKEMRGVRHHLLDVASPKKTFTAHDFVIHAERAVRDIAGRGRLPILCGGTGLYIDALLGRVSLGDAERNDALRARLEKKTARQLFALLRKRDPARAKKMDTPSERNNKVRLIRALEIASQKTAKTRKATPYEFDAEWIGIALPKTELRKRIQKRLAMRMRGGMVTEAKRLHARGLSYKRMRELGLEYRYLADYLEGRLDKSEMQKQLEAKIWQYAKRQMTYWKRNKKIKWKRKGGR